MISVLLGLVGSGSIDQRRARPSQVAVLLLTMTPFGGDVIDAFDRVLLEGGPRRLRPVPPGAPWATPTYRW